MISAVYATLGIGTGWVQSGTSNLVIIVYIMVSSSRNGQGRLHTLHMM